MGLNSRQGGGGDLPSLDLAFALDKTLTSRKGPTPAFTRSSTATFVGSNGLIQSAIIDAPRFDHDPATGVCKGLLIEESRTNLIATSVPGTNWTSGTGAHTVTQNSTDVGVSPDGSLPTKVVCATSGNYQISFAAVTGTQYTASIYARVLSGTGPIRVGGIVAGAFSSDTATSQWARYSKTDISATTGTRFLQLSMVAGETIYLWGAQLEAGAFPLSYIPTTSGTAARSADVCSIAGTDFSSFYNQPEGSVIINGDSWNGTAPAWCSFNVGSVRTFEFVRLGSDIIHSDSFAGVTIVKASPTFPNKFGFARGQVNGFGSFGGVTGGSTTVPQLATPNRLQIGLGVSVGAGYLNGCIKSLTYYRKQLSTLKLNPLTAP